MFLADAVKTAVETHWWDDWLKFTPGWLAFIVTVVTGGRKIWLRRHAVALGADDDKLREALESARTYFEDIVHEGQRAPWFTDEKRRETARKIRDLAERRSDETLRTELTRVADAWDEAFALAPGAAGPWFLREGQDETPQQRAESARVQEQFGKESDVARRALKHVAVALARLNKLERRTIGRS